MQDMGLYVLVGDGDAADGRVPILASRDPELVEAVTRAITRRLGAESAVVRRLRAARPPQKPQPDERRGT